MYIKFLILAHQDSVGPDNIGGFDKVEALATYLVSLTSTSDVSLTNDQALRIIDLWEQLDPYD